MAERCTPDRSRVELPFIEVLVQNPVTTSTNFAGRLYGCDARGKAAEMARGGTEIVGIRLAPGGIDTEEMRIKNAELRMKN